MGFNENNIDDVNEGIYWEYKLSWTGIRIKRMIAKNDKG